MLITPRRLDFAHSPEWRTSLICAFEGSKRNGIVADETYSGSLGFIVASINRKLERQLEERLRPANIVLDQARALRVLAEQGGKTGLIMSELSRLLVIDASTLTKIIDRMCSEGLVYRAPDPTDRRRVRILLSTNGKTLLRKIRPLMAKQEADFQKAVKEVMDDDSVDALKTLLGRLDTSIPARN